MNLKTYRARSMAAALADVKKDLGSAAVILRTRSYRVGGMMGVGGHEEYEITAADGPVEGLAASGPTAGGSVGGTSRASRALSAGMVPAEALGEVGAAGLALSSNTRDITLQDGEFRPHTFSAIGMREEPGREPVREMAREVPREVQREPAREVPKPAPRLASPAALPVAQQVEAKPSPAPSMSGKEQLTTAVDFAPTDGAALRTLQGELSSIRRLMGTLLAETRRGGASSAAAMAAIPGLGIGLGVGIGAAASGPASPSNATGASDALTDIFMTLHDACVRPDLIDRVIGGVRDELTPDELGQAQIVRLSTLRQLAGMLRVRGPAVLVPGAGVRTIALVGTTGVGKTTTVAKLAAMFKIKHGLRVGLITIDTYRIAAVEQLRTYANIIGLPLEVCLTPSDVEQASARLSATCDLILLDTAGRSQHDNRRLDELAGFVSAARPHEVHLVLSVASSETVIASAARRFASMRPDCVLLTKLDEGVAHGAVLNAAHSVGLPISFVTMGQEVPDHLDVADAHRLARMILEGASPDGANRGEAACHS